VRASEQQMVLRRTKDFTNIRFNTAMNFMSAFKSPSTATTKATTSSIFKQKHQLQIYGL